MADPTGRARWQEAHVGLDFFARRGLVRGDQPAPSGLIEALAELAHPGLDPDAVPVASADFLLRTSALDLLIRPRWLRGFRWAARAAHAVGARVGQMSMPVAEARILTTLAPLVARPEHLPGERACLRRYDDGAVMQVVRYAAFRQGDAGFLRVTFPLPVGALEGVLRLDEAGRDGEGRPVVRLTSERRAGSDDPTGVRLVIGRTRVRLPLGETMTFWPVDSTLAPADFAPELWPGTTLLSRHEQRLGGVRFARHSYYFRPALTGSSGSRHGRRWPGARTSGGSCT